MKTAYIDTNILISFIKSDDPFHNEAKRLFKTPAAIYSITSSLLLVEMKAILAKQMQILEQNLPEAIEKLMQDLEHHEKVEVFMNYLLETVPIEIQENPMIERMELLGTKVLKCPAAYAIAMRIVGITRLRTLDNLHIAHLLLLQRKAIKFDYFVTGDKMILKRKKEIEELTGTLVVTPKELERIEST